MKIGGKNFLPRKLCRLAVAASTFRYSDRTAAGGGVHRHSAMGANRQPHQIIIIGTRHGIGQYFIFSMATDDDAKYV